MREFTSTPGQVAAPEDNPLAGLSFKLDGEEFRCDGEVRVFKLSAMARTARSGDQNAQAALMAESLWMALGTEEYDRFVLHTEKHDTTDEVVLQVMGWINEQAEAKAAELAGRPTQRRPSSPSGPSAKGDRTSRVISLQTGDVTVIHEGQPGYQAPPGLTGKRPAKTTPRNRGKRTA